MRAINANTVRGCSYENYFTRKFLIRKFLNTKISRFIIYCTGFHLYTHTSKLWQQVFVRCTSESINSCDSTTWLRRHTLSPKLNADPPGAGGSGFWITPLHKFEVHVAKTGERNSRTSGMYLSKSSSRVLAVLLFLSGCGWLVSQVRATSLQLMVEELM